MIWHDAYVERSHEITLQEYELASGTGYEMGTIMQSCTLQMLLSPEAVPSSSVEHTTTVLGVPKFSYPCRQTILRIDELFIFIHATNAMQALKVK